MWLYTGRNSRWKEEEERHRWTTEDEIKFVMGLGYWKKDFSIPTREERITKLQQYLVSLESRSDMGNIDWEEVKNRVKAHIEHLMRGGEDIAMPKLWK